MVEPVGQCGLGSELSAARSRKDEWTVAGDAAWAGDGGSTVRSVSLEQRHVHRQRDQRAGTQSAKGPADRVWNCGRALPARQSGLRRYAAMVRVSGSTKPAEHGGHGNYEGSIRSSRNGRDGDRDYGVDLRMQQRFDFGRSTNLLRDGAR